MSEYGDFTWHVTLWLNNDEGMYRAVQDLAWTYDDVLDAEMLDNFVRDVIIGFDEFSGLTADLLARALDSVDWYEAVDSVRPEKTEE